MISIDDACQTYGVDRDTVERWIIQDGVDYRYIWRGDAKIKMVPRNWLMERTAGEGLTPQLIDEKGNPIREAFSSVPMGATPLEPTEGEKRAFEMMQQLLTLQEHQEKRISKSTKFYSAVFILAFAVMAVGVFYTLWENKTSLNLTKAISEFSQRDTVEQERSVLQKKVLELQSYLQSKDHKIDFLQSTLENKQRENAKLTQQIRDLDYQIKASELNAQKKELQLKNWKNSSESEQLSKERKKLLEELLAERKKTIELDKKQIELSFQLKTAQLQRDLELLKSELEKTKEKLKQRDQQIRNLQLMIGK